MSDILIEKLASLLKSQLQQWRQYFEFRKHCGFVSATIPFESVASRTAQTATSCKRSKDGNEANCAVLELQHQQRFRLSQAIPGRESKETESPSNRKISRSTKNWKIHRSIARSTPLLQLDTLKTRLAQMYCDLTMNGIGGAECPSRMVFCAAAECGEWKYFGRFWSTKTRRAFRATVTARNLIGAEGLIFGCCIGLEADQTGCIV